MSLAQRRGMVDRNHPSLSITRQCASASAGAGSVGSEPIRPVLPIQGNLGRGSGPDASHGTTILGDPLLRVSAYERLAGATGDGGGPEKAAAADAHHRAAGQIQGFPHQSVGAGAPGISLFIS